jgi:hypothetical protein
MGLASQLQTQQEATQALKPKAGLILIFEFEELILFQRT